jgi:hypothetical protein
MTQAQDIIASGFDLAFLDAPQDEQVSRVIVVTNADGDDECGFIVVGKNSQQYQDAQHQIRVEGLKRSSKRKTQIDTSTDQGAATLAKTIERNEITLAKAVVVGWFGFKSGGKEAPFNSAMLDKMFAVKPTWKDKINAQVENEANFSKG